MKKFTLLFSMLAVAASAFAYNAPEAGKMFVINAGRPWVNSGETYQYMAYSAEDKTYSNGSDFTSNLWMSNVLDETCVWVLSEGSEEGAYIVKNYTADKYLASIAAYRDNVVDEPMNIYFEAAFSDDSNKYSISITPEGGRNSSMNASNWCPLIGEWTKTDAGSPWYLTIVDVKEGQTVAEALETLYIGPSAENLAASALAELEGYKVNVPAIADMMDAAINEIKALNPGAYETTAAFSDKVNEVKDAAIVAANEALPGKLVDKSWNIINKRRAGLTTSTRFTGAYLYATNYVADETVLYQNSNGEDVTVGFTGIGYNTSALEDNTAAAVFTFVAVEGGVIMYNTTTASYIANDVANIPGTAADWTYDANAVSVPVVGTTDAAAARVIVPGLYNGSVQFLAGTTTPDEDGDAYSVSLNIDTNGNPLVLYYANDGGATWNMEETTGAGIQSIESAVEASAEGIYDLLGRKLAAPVKGINIINGVKVLVK